DESQYSLWDHDGRRRVRCQNFQFAIERHAPLVQEVMVRGAISYGNFINANRHIGNVLEPVLIPHVNGFCRTPRALPHSVTNAREFLERPQIGSLQHPPNNKVELRHRIRDPWDEIPQPDIGNLMPRRVADCIRNRGGTIHY
ncbi:hypothetical protein BDFB_005462, partial [Asbolus verrucosus]